MSYESLGIVPKDYKNEQHEVQSIGLITEPNLVLKLYHMFVSDKPLDPNYLEQNMEYIEKQIRDDVIKSHIGMGFAKVCKDAIGVATWDENNPIVIQSQLFYVKNQDISTAEEMNIGEEGPYCVWELGIVAHEKEAWKRYLDSQHTEKDKEKYLNDTIEGLL